MLSLLPSFIVAVLFWSWSMLVFVFVIHAVVCIPVNRHDFAVFCDPSLRIQLTPQPRLFGIYLGSAPCVSVNINININIGIYLHLVSLPRAMRGCWPG